MGLQSICLTKLTDHSNLSTRNNTMLGEEKELNFLDHSDWELPAQKTRKQLFMHQPRAESSYWISTSLAIIFNSQVSKIF